jgi:hypothetical protein
MEYLRDGKKDTGTATKGTEKVGSDRESTNTGTTESGGSGNDTLEFPVHALLTVTSHDETLVLELLRDITRSRARNLNPSLGEEGAGNEHEGDVNSCVDGVKERLLEVQRRGHVVGDTRSGVELGRTLTRFPNTEKLDKDVVREAGVQHLADEENVGAQSRLEHNGHVGSVEQTDGVRATHSTLARGLDRDLNAEALEVDNSGEDHKGGEQVHDVGQVLAVESLAQSTLLVGPGEEEVEESNDGTLEFRTTTSVDGGGGEGLPHNGLADVCRDEERDTASKTVALLEQLVEENDDQTSNNQLDNQQNTDTSTKVTWLPVEASQDVHTGLSEREDDSEELLSGLVELSVGLEVKVDVNEMGTSEELREEQMSQYSFDIEGILVIQLEPLTWKTMPEEIMGVIPNSMRVPRLLASIIRSQ